jgi:hypothetical protein
MSETSSSNSSSSGSSSSSSSSSSNIAVGAATGGGGGLNETTWEWNLSDECWKEKLAAEFEKPYHKSLTTFVSGEYAKKTIFPPRDQVFNAFNFAPFHDIKVCPRKELVFSFTATPTQPSSPFDPVHPVLSLHPAPIGCDYRSRPIPRRQSGPRVVFFSAARSTHSSVVAEYDRGTPQ